MTSRELAGLGVALAAAGCFEGGYTLQALEARRADRRRSMRASLFGALLRRPLWVAGIGLGFLGVVLQALALRLASVSLVQPVLACGVILLLVLGATVLHEPVGRSEVLAAAVVVAGVAVVALTAPPRGRVAQDLRLVLVLAGLGALAAAPALLARFRAPPGPLLVLAAGAGDVWGVIALRLVGDEIAAGRLGAAAAWALAGGLALAVGLLAETSALQVMGATRVGPSVLVLQVAGPVLLAPLVLGESWAGTPGHGAVLLAAVTALAAAAWTLAARESGVPPPGPHPATTPSPDRAVAAPRGRA